jgi:hypothetical protein
MAKGYKSRVQTTQGTFFTVDKHTGKETEINGFEAASTEAAKCGCGIDCCDGSIRLKASDGVVVRATIELVEGNYTWVFSTNTPSE